MLPGKNIFITSAASGAGKRTAELALSMGANDYGVVKNKPDQLSGHFLQADLGSEKGGLEATFFTDVMKFHRRQP